MLTAESTSLVLDRFYGFDDGLLRSVSIALPVSQSLRTAVIVCAARDSSTSEWVHVTWTVRGLSEFSLAQGHVSYIVLSQGLQIGWFAGRVYLDFGPYSCVPAGEDDFRRSGFYFTGAHVTWSVGPYQETE